MLLAVFRLLSRLPLSWLQSAGRWLGWLVYAVSPAYRRKLAANLERAGLPASLRLSVAGATGEMVGELPWIWFRDPRQVRERVRCPDDSAVRAARAAQRPVMLLTPHLGSFEVCARWYAGLAPITVLFRPPKLAALAPVLQAARNVGGMSAAPANVGGVRALLRALRGGQAVGLLPDQVPGGGEGRWVPFLGAPAYTMTLPERLARGGDVAVILLVCERLPGGAGWEIRLEPLADAPSPEAVNAAMERAIRSLPRQYLWGYNRYKRPAGVAPPADAVDAA